MRSLYKMIFAICLLMGLAIVGIAIADQRKNAVAIRTANPPSQPQPMDLQTSEDTSPQLTQMQQKLKTMMDAMTPDMNQDDMMKNMQTLMEMSKELMQMKMAMMQQRMTMMESMMQKRMAMKKNKMMMCQVKMQMKMMMMQLKTQMMMNYYKNKGSDSGNNVKANPTEQ